MDLRYFFRGMLDHEVSTSAFLAMMLDGCTPFRQAFLSAVLPEASELGDERWHVDVETDQVDVTVQCRTWLILVENKIQGGSVTPGQLRRYYTVARQKEPSERRIAAVWLAPRGVGHRQVDLVREVLREGDHATYLSWERDVREWIGSLPHGPEEQLAASGLQATLGIIEARRRGLAVSDERLEMRRIAAWGLEEIKTRRPDIPLLSWEGADREQILTRRTSTYAFYVTMRFPESGPPDHIPLTAPSDGRRTVTVQTLLRKGATIKASSALGSAWATRSDAFDVPGVGVHRRAGRGGWFEWSEQTTGTSEEIAARLAQIAVSGIAALEEFQAGIGHEAVPAGT